jgi:hypothetical protein
MTVRDLSEYGAIFAEVLSEPRVMGLGPGTPNGPARALLEAATVEAAFAGRGVVDPVMARAALAGVWLYHDFFDESHEISQAIETPTGGYWHGILHRREPDYDNARYWFRRVGGHPVFPLLDHQAHRIGGGTRWDPFRFIDVCEQAANAGGDLERACLDIQMTEWWALFKFCYDKAIGRG